MAEILNILLYFEWESNPQPVQSQNITPAPRLVSITVAEAHRSVVGQCMSVNAMDSIST